MESKQNQNARSIESAPQSPSRFALWWVLAVNCGMVLLGVRYYWVPMGKEIRPMGDAVLVFMLMLAGLAGILLALPTLFKRRRLVWPWLAIQLSVCPYPLFILIPPCTASPWVYFRAMNRQPNEHRGVDAGWCLLFGFERPRPRATQDERWI